MDSDGKIITKLDSIPGNIYDGKEFPLKKHQTKPEIERKFAELKRFHGLKETRY